MSVLGVQLVKGAFQVDFKYSGIVNKGIRNHLGQDCSILSYNSRFGTLYYGKDWEGEDLGKE